MPVLAHAKANERATAGTGADAGFEMGIEDGRLPLIGLILSVGKMRVQSSLRLGRYVFPIIARWSSGVPPGGVQRSAPLRRI